MRGGLFLLFCHEFHALFGVLFTDLNDAVAYHAWYGCLRVLFLEIKDDF